MPNFSLFDLSPTLLAAIKDLGFEKPTPVQQKVLPLVIQNRNDLVVLAQTGTGKTASFGLPLVQITDTKSKATQSVVLCPTRELCVQITKDLTAFAKYVPDVKVLAVYGGASIETQIRAIKQGVQIVVATPGRMNDLIRRKVLKLANVKQLVLDEADEMLNMGFQEELESILSELPSDVRKLLFSATMSAEVARIAGKYMNTPEEIIVGQKNAGSENVSHECYTVHAKDRYETLKRILDFHRNIYGIVFCRTRAETQDVASALIADGYSAEPLHGDLSQDQRDRVMKKFRSQIVKVLVATDVAARGLDVNNLTHVINYNLPDEAEAYTHRSGRTGRAGKEGVSIIITNMREDFRIRNLERIVKKKFTHRQVPTGQAVCESQLMGLLERIKEVNVDKDQLGPFMPAINAALGDISSEEMLKRFLLLEFNRFLEYYKDAKDLNQGHKSSEPKRPARRSENEANEMVVLEVNFGRKHRLTPAALITMINRSVRGPKLALGRIGIEDDYSIFEVCREDSDHLISNLGKSRYNNHKVLVKVVEDNSNNKNNSGEYRKQRRR